MGFMLLLGSPACYSFQETLLETLEKEQTATRLLKIRGLAIATKTMDGKSGKSRSTGSIFIILCFPTFSFFLYCRGLISFTSAKSHLPFIVQWFSSCAFNFSFSSCMPCSHHLPKLCLNILTAGLSPHSPVT